MTVSDDAVAAAVADLSPPTSALGRHERGARARRSPTASPGVRARSGSCPRSSASLAAMSRVACCSSTGAAPTAERAPSSWTGAAASGSSARRRSRSARRTGARRPSGCSTSWPAPSGGRPAASRPCRSGFAYSYPARLERIDRAIALGLTKGWRTPGLVGRDVAGLLDEALARRPVRGVSVAAICNDTVACLALSSYRARGRDRGDRHADIGLIVATGTNQAADLGAARHPKSRVRKLRRRRRDRDGVGRRAGPRARRSGAGRPALREDGRRPLPRRDRPPRGCGISPTGHGSFEDGGRRRSPRRLRSTR